MSAAGVIAQAALAGTFLAGGHHRALDAHQVLGPLLVLPTLASAIVIRLYLSATEAGTRAFRAAVGLTAALLIETALGFISDDHPAALVAHIPIAVGIFGMLVTQLHYLRQVAKDSEAVTAATAIQRPNRPIPSDASRSDMSRSAGSDKQKGKS